MLNVLYQSDDLLVLDKPSGVAVLEDRIGAPSLWPVLKSEFDHPRLVHRIDKGTSGVLLVALSRTCQRTLTRAFAAREIRKHYVAAVSGHLPQGRTLDIDLPLTRGRKSRYRVAGLREEIRPTRSGWFIATSGRDGHDSRTRVRLVARGPRRSLVAVNPVTGRSHQIRVHLSWIGHAIVGDTLYGAPKSEEQAWPRLALHCHRLVVPGFGCFTAAVPKEVSEAALG